MKKALAIGSLIAALVLALAGCDTSHNDDVFVGNWQQVSVDGVPTVLVTVIQVTDGGYVGTTAGIQTNAGTWTKSGDTYTLTGAFFGFISTTSAITPAFTSADNTMTYTDSSGYVEIYNRQ